MSNNKSKLLKEQKKANKIYNDSIWKPIYIQRDSISKLKKLYANYPSNEIANYYAMALFNLSLHVKIDEILDISLKLDSLFEKNPTKDIAEVIGRIKFNISIYLDEDVYVLKKYAKEIEDLYQQYKTKNLAEPLVKIWYSIAICNKEEYSTYAKKIIDLCSKVSDPMANTAYARILFDNEYKLKNREDLIKKFLSNTQDLDSFRAYIESPFYPQCNEGLINFKLFSSYPIEDLGKKINYLFEKFKKRSEYSDIKYSDIKAEILALLYYSMKIKKLLMISHVKDSIGHYTKIDNLKYLILPNKLSGKLRMYNAEYMNDPSEGKSLMKFLSNHTTFNYDESDKQEYSKIYLSCFTTEIDNLPMWSIYGNDGQGCCLVFNEDYFDSTNEELTDDLWLNNKTTNIRNYLYRICYIDFDSDKLTIDKFDNDPADLKKQVKKVLKDVMFHLNKINLLKKKNDKIIDKMVMLILEQVRYLFKDISYSHEHELRLIRYSETPLIDNDKWIVPQLYVEMEKPLEYEQIILGPKVTQVNKIVPYIMHTGKCKQVIKSNIKYR